MASVSSQDEITFFNERLSVPDEVEALIDSFEDWVSTTHPEDAEFVSFGRWESVDEAQRGGELRNRYVAKYAHYLAENGCTPSMSRVCRDGRDPAATGSPALRAERAKVVPILGKSITCLGRQTTIVPQL
jgi:hypothetical protein